MYKIINRYYSKNVLTFEVKGIMPADIKKEISNDEKFKDVKNVIKVVRFLHI